MPLRLPAAAQTAPNYYDAVYIAGVADKIIAWKKTALGLSAGQSLLDDGLAAAAGSYDDWYATGVGRLPGYGESGGRFLTALEQAVLVNISNSTSPSFKVTDIHRNILAILAAGGDPTRIRNGSGELNLLAD